MKKIILTVLVMATAIAVRADYLYWMVADNQFDESSEDVEKYGYTAFAYLKATDKGDNLDSNAVVIDHRTISEVKDAADYGDQFQAIVNTPYNSKTYSFFIELANGLRTEATSWDYLSQYVYSGGLNVPDTLSQSGFGQPSGTSYNVPEPTSGLLFLIGGMLLGLKRRRQA